MIAKDEQNHSHPPMSRTSKKIVNTTADKLNELVDSDPRVDQLMHANVEDLTVLDLINEVVSELTGGLTIVAARETDGTLVGFVPKRARAVAKTEVASAAGGVE